MLGGKHVCGFTIYSKGEFSILFFMSVISPPCTEGTFCPVNSPLNPKQALIQERLTPASSFTTQTLCSVPALGAVTPSSTQWPS